MFDAVATLKRRKSATRPYHHGDLRSTLLAAAWDIVGEQGVDALSLRACARRAGVSHAAPAHHFAGIADLIDAFAVEGYERMAATMDAVANEYAGQPLLAAGLGYIKFAISFPDHFRVMLKIEATSDGSAELQNATRAIRMRLETALKSAYRSAHGRELTPTELAQKTALAWCCVHGYVTLNIDLAAANGRLPDPLTILSELRPSLMQ